MGIGAEGLCRTERTMAYDDIHTPVLLDRCVELLAPALQRDGAVVVLQAAFEFIGFSGLGLGHAELANGNRVIQSAYTFRMENGLGLPAQCGAR